VPPEAFQNTARTVERRRFGSTGREVAVIGQGTWYIEQADAVMAIAALRRGLDLGMTHIDTAEMYGSGAAEELVGAAIAERRDEVFLVSKVLPHNASRNGTVAACERSLKRLKTDRLDCYLLHWRGPPHPLEDTVSAFEQLRADGKILSWGVSNFDVDDLDEVHRITGAGHPACNQVLYHLRERAIEQAVIPWCERNGVAVVAYSPFGHAGGFPERRSAGGRVLKEIADRHNAGPGQVALRFLTRRASLLAIPKASNPEHAAENAGAGALNLSAAELARIDAAFPVDPRPRALPML
jgi:diketogulonate reductase-like aldo/keto reductase